MYIAIGEIRFEFWGCFFSLMWGGGGGGTSSRHLRPSSGREHLREQLYNLFSPVMMIMNETRRKPTTGREPRSLPFPSLFPFSVAQSRLDIPEPLIPGVPPFLGGKPKCSVRVVLNPPNAPPTEPYRLRRRLPIDNTKFTF